MNEIRSAFPGQDKNEPVFIFLRRYYLAFLPFLAIILVMLIISFSMFYLTLFSLRHNPDVSSVIYNWAVTGSGFFVLFSIVFTVIAWFDFYFDIHIVTDRRVVDINQNKLFHREISELNLEDIEDVSVNYIGILKTIFNYGDIEIQTAGVRNNFHFPDIANPRDVASVISDLAEQAKRGVTEHYRFPQSSVKGVINNAVIKSREGLISEGALRPDEKMDAEEQVKDRSHA